MTKQDPTPFAKSFANWLNVLDPLEEPDRNKENQIAKENELELKKKLESPLQPQTAAVLIPTFSPVTGSSTEDYAFAHLDKHREQRHARQIRHAKDLFVERARNQGSQAVRRLGINLWYRPALRYCIEGLRRNLVQAATRGAAARNLTSALRELFGGQTLASLIRGWWSRTLMGRLAVIQQFTTRYSQKLAVIRDAAQGQGEELIREVRAWALRVLLLQCLQANLRSRLAELRALYGWKFNHLQKHRRMLVGARKMRRVLGRWMNYICLSLIRRMRENTELHRRELIFKQVDAKWLRRVAEAWETASASIDRSAETLDRALSLCREPQWRQGAGAQSIKGLTRLFLRVRDMNAVPRLVRQWRQNADEAGPSLAAFHCMPPLGGAPFFPSPGPPLNVVPLSPFPAVRHGNGPATSTYTSFGLQGSHIPSVNHIQPTQLSPTKGLDELQRSLEILSVSAGRQGSVYAGTSQ